MTCTRITKTSMTTCSACTESTDALRDLISTIVETNLSLRDYRTNQIAKQVTSWAAIIAVPTLITGWYGMNVPYPGFARTWGVWRRGPVGRGLSGGIFLIFRRGPVAAAATARASTRLRLDWSSTARPNDAVFSRPPWRCPRRATWRCAPSTTPIAGDESDLDSARAGLARILADAPNASIEPYAPLGPCPSSTGRR